MQSLHCTKSDRIGRLLTQEGWFRLDFEKTADISRRHPSLVSPRNDGWETSTEIPYWWRVTTHIWVVLLIDWRKFSANQKHYPDLGRTVASSKWNFCTRLSDIISRETRGGVAKCRLLACSRPSDSRERRGVKNSRKSEGDWRELSSLFLCLRRFHFFFFCPFFYLAPLRPGQLLCHSLALGAQIFIPYWIAFHIAIAYNVDIDKNSSFPNTCSVPRALILCPNPFLSWVINLADRRPLRGNFWFSICCSWDSPRACPLIFSGKRSEPGKILLVSGKATPLILCLLSRAYTTPPE